MTRLRVLISRLRALLGMRRIDREFEQELQSHLAMLTEENVRRGMSLEAARRAARLRLGNPDSLRVTNRELRGIAWIETLGQDVRFGARMLRRSPGFAVVAVITLALGIGANTAIFSAVNGILLEPLVYAHSSRLVNGMMVSLPEFREIQKQCTAFDGTAFYFPVAQPILGGGIPVNRTDSYVSAGFFLMLGVHPLLGRYMLPGDAEPGAAGVAVLSYQLWMGDFGGDPHVVGRKIYVAQKPYTVVGVMPKGFDIGADWMGPRAGSGLWLPWVYPPPDKAAREENLWPNHSFVARLKKGVTVDEANAQLKVISEHLESENPRAQGGRVISVESVKGQLVQTAQTGLLILFGAVGFVLLLAYANVSSLLVARSWTRQQELAIRRSLGATRLRIARQLLLETLLLALAGGVLALFVGTWGVHLLRAVAPPYTPRVDDIRLDTNVLLFTVVISLLAVVLVGLAPALQATSSRAGSTLKGGLIGAFAGTGHRRTHRPRSALVVAEVLLAVIVVAGGALMGLSFYKLMTFDTGLHADHVITMNVELSDTACFGGSESKGVYYPGPSTGKGCVLMESILGGVQAISGVERAAVASVGFLGGGLASGEVYVKGARVYQSPGGVVGEGVTPDYFATLGIRLLKGRYFDSTDMSGGRRVAIVSEGFAQKYMPGNPLGKEFAVNKDEKGQPQWMEIVGEVGTVRMRAVGQVATELGSLEQYYTPAAFGSDSSFILARTSVNPTLIVPAIERVVRSAYKDAVITQIKTVTQILAEGTAEPRFQTLLLGSFGGLGLLLAIVGVYGVISYSVVQRTHEIGVRMALGAQRGDVLRMVLREGMLLAIAGIVLGIGGALALTRVLRNMLFEIKPNDPTTFVGVVVALAFAALAACYLPARRAASVDPVTALKYE